MKNLLPHLLATAFTLHHTTASIIPPASTISNPTINPTTPNIPLSKRGFPSIPSKKSIVTIPEVNGSPYTLTFDFHPHNYDASMPAIGSQSFALGYATCLTEFKKLLEIFGRQVSNSRQDQRGSLLPLSTTELVKLGGEVRPGKENWFQCGDPGTLNVENGFKLIIAAAYDVKASQYPSWAEIGVAIQGMSAGMDRPERMHASNMHLWRPKKMHAAMQATGLDRFEGLNKLYALGRSQIVNAQISVVFQGVHATGSRGPKGRGRGFWGSSSDSEDGGVGSASESWTGGGGNVASSGNTGTSGNTGATGTTGTTGSVGNAGSPGTSGNTRNTGSRTSSGFSRWLGSSGGDSRQGPN